MRKINYIIVLFLISLLFISVYADNELMKSEKDPLLSGNIIKAGSFGQTTGDLPASTYSAPKIVWNTFLGGGNLDEGYSIATDSSGNVYIAGYSENNWGIPVSSHSGNKDILVAKFDSCGVLKWHTFLGGTADDEGLGVFLDSSGNVYVTGRSCDTWGTPVRPFSGGYQDAFVAKLNNSGILQWNTFIGGAENDYGIAIVLDTSSNIYIAGCSNHTWGIPTIPFAGWQDVFVAKLNNSGALQGHSFLGSAESNDYVYGISLDTLNNIYITGSSSDSWGSPVQGFSGSDDAFIAKLNSTGSLQWHTFLGGSGSDIGRGIILDSSTSVYITGYSAATWGSPLNSYVENTDAFVAKLNSAGVLQWNTFIGGSGWDKAYSIALDSNSDVYVSGSSSATWGTPGNTHSGQYDAFIAKFNSSGLFLSNTFAGSAGPDEGYSLALDNSSNIYITGYSKTTWGNPVAPYAGGLSDAFVAKFSQTSANPDFNQDSKVDILWRHSTTGANYVWFMDGISRTGGAYLAGLTDLNWEVAGTGDFNSDGKTDILWRNYSTGQNYVWYMDGISKTSGAYLTVLPDTNWKIVGTGDFNSDEKIDILWRNNTIGANYVWYMDGVTKSGGAYLPGIIDPDWDIAGTGDFNSDGKVDVLWRHRTKGANYVWYMNGVVRTSGTYLPGMTNFDWEIIGTGDFNSDGKVDVLWRNYSTGQNYIWFMDGVIRTSGAYLDLLADTNWKIVN